MVRPSTPWVALSVAGCEPRLSTAKANCPQWMMVINDLIPGSCFYAPPVYAICIRGNVITASTWRVGGRGRACGTLSITFVQQQPARQSNPLLLAINAKPASLLTCTQHINIVVHLLRVKATYRLHRVDKNATDCIRLYPLIQCSIYRGVLAV